MIKNHIRSVGIQAYIGLSDTVNGAEGVMHTFTAMLACHPGNVQFDFLHGSVLCWKILKTRNTHDLG
jgi:hypothetical protein